jgi:hypothetical protein
MDGILDYAYRYNQVNNIIYIDAPCQRVRRMRDFGAAWYPEQVLLSVP